MYTLNVFDNRTGAETEKQVKEFKEELKQEIDYSIEDSKLEDSLIEWINKNRVHQTIIVGSHVRELGFPVNDEHIGRVPDSCETLLVAHSEKYNHLLFKLTYKPQDPYEAWVKYYKNGKIQFCPAKLVVDDFDEKKLK